LKPTLVEQYGVVRLALFGSTVRNEAHDKSDIDGYAYLVPYVENEEEIFLKTIIPSRKATKRYLGDENG